MHAMPRERPVKAVTAATPDYLAAMITARTFNFYTTR